jgi:hypothetical protein
MLCLSVELFLSSLVLAYPVLAIILGIRKAWSYLTSKSNAKTEEQKREERDYLRHKERISLTFAGFSLTALTLFVSIQLRELAQLSSTIFFFSTAFSLLILSYLSSLISRVRFFTYLSDVLLNTSLLAIACGFLIFFGNFLSWNNGSTIIFIILATALFVGASYEQYFFLEVTKDFQEVKK